MALLVAVGAGLLLAVWLAHKLHGGGPSYYVEMTRAEREAEEAARKAWRAY